MTDATNSGSLDAIDDSLPGCSSEPVESAGIQRLSTDSTEEEDEGAHVGGGDDTTNTGCAVLDAIEDISPPQTVQITVDSGAAEAVAPPTAQASTYKVKSSPGSRSGTKCRTARWD